MAKKFYVTTAIDYVNARPHIGHAFEKVIADALIRWKKQKNVKTWFLTGTDENAQKNAQVAKEKGMPIRKFVDTNSRIFIELCKKLNISNDDFIRTTEERHTKIAKEIFKKVYEKGEIYKGAYEGWYCVGCEEFKTGKNLVNGLCPEHYKKPEWISEEAYFFKLSKYKKELTEFVKGYIVPESKRNEILSRLKNEELRDLCVSRKNLDWGIDSPVDKKYKIYVWFDALINYISGASGNWPADVHVIGKGINWFHSVIWPAILISAGYKLPKTLLVHGYLNLRGQKISKSLGNVIDPLELIEKYGADAVRYSLFRCSVFEDSDYSEEILIERNNNELANKLGNLVSRVSSLIEKNGVTKTQNPLIKKLNEKKINESMEKYEFDKALSEIFTFIDVCNQYVQDKKPWGTNDKKVLFELKESIIKIAELLWPFIPESSEKIKKCFSGSKVKKSEILFKKIEIKEEKVIKEEKIEGVMTNVSFSEWEKLDLRVAKILKAEDIEGADKLYKLSLDVGKEIGKRTICAGIKPYYSKDELKNKKIIVFANLEPRKIKGIESQGMLLAASTSDHGKVILLKSKNDVFQGEKVIFQNG
ncbi:MAG: methionine--tRNA ligase [Nanoarchaeota archaeon]